MAVKIGNKLVGEGHPCFVVAEIGINHNGSLEITQHLIDVAVAAGCDAVKFQKRTVEIVYSKEERGKPRMVEESVIKNAMKRRMVEEVDYYILPESSLSRLQVDIRDTTNGDLKYALEFGLKEFDAIDRYCREKNIMWFASCWDGLSAHFINGFNVPCHKIASACLTHADLLRRARYKGKPIILSTGGSSLVQIEKAVEILGQKDLIILHCTANYPCPDSEINLQFMLTLKSKFPDVPIGYSGHEIDILPSVLAVQLGASVIERHITVDKNMPGSDQKASLEPHELRELVRVIRVSDYSLCRGQQKRIETIMGDGVKRVFDSELAVMKKLRRVQNF